MNQSIWRSQVSSRRLHLNAYSEAIIAIIKVAIIVDQFKQCHPLQCSSQSQQSTDSIGPQSAARGPMVARRNIPGGPQWHIDVS